VPQDGRARLDRILGQPPAGVDLDAVATICRYVGSPEHKDKPSFAGQPRPRTDASICDQRLNSAEQITTWLRAAIQKGAFGRLWEGNMPQFPRYVWYKDGETVYEGRLLNQELGEYKGYPLEREEWPDGIERLYD
jgi:hypothetical protein